MNPLLRMIFRVALLALGVGAMPFPTWSGACVASASGGETPRGPVGPALRQPSQGTQRSTHLRSPQPFPANRHADPPRPAQRAAAKVPASTTLKMLAPAVIPQQFAPRQNDTPNPSVSAPTQLPQLPQLRISRLPRRGKGADGVKEGDDAFQIFVSNEDIRQVLSMLGKAGGLNIVPTPNVRGIVSFSFVDVSIEEALQAILLSNGLVSRREGRFIFVGTPQDFAAYDQRFDRIGFRIYRPNYIAAAEVRELLTQMMTPGIGKISVTQPAQTGIGTDDTQAGGNSHAGDETVLVHDFESKLALMDHIVADLDCRPLQVAIEAMILSVKLDDENELGVDFEFLKNQGTIRFGLGTPPANLSQVNFDDGGLTFAFLDTSTTVFIKAVESFGDVSVISTPRLLTLNKQRAEILIGAELGYISTTVTETTATQNVEFLEVGTQLRLRPFISPDGMIRMEIHPELSTGQVRVESGLTLPDKEVTKVTTNIMVRDGATAVIGGLMRDDVTKTGQQVPWLGGAPWIGGLFRQKKEQAERREIIVLVTPRIVSNDQLNDEGRQLAHEFHHRASVFADSTSPIGKQYLGRKYYRMALQAWKCGDCQRAKRFASLSVQYNPLDRGAIELRSRIEARCCQEKCRGRGCRR